MNVGKKKMIEVVKGYKMNENELGCKFHKVCYTCPFKDCIKDKKYAIPPAQAQATFEQEFAKSWDMITGKGGKG